MGYEINPVYWLKTEADRIESIVLMPKYWSFTWTAASLQAELLAIGLTYTVDQCQLILKELVVRRVVIEN